MAKNYINSNISFYMKPKKIIEIKSFPRNSSGKIDRKKLKQIAINYMEENKNKYIAPKTDIEIDIFNYIKELIGTDEFSVTDDFIDDLGHQLCSQRFRSMDRTPFDHYRLLLLRSSLRKYK